MRLNLCRCGGSDGSFIVTWNDYGPQWLLDVDTSGLQFVARVSVQTAGVNQSSDGVREVQAISLPAGVIGGTWTVNGASLSFDASEKWGTGPVIQNWTRPRLFMRCRSP